MTQDPNVPPIPPTGGSVPPMGASVPPDGTVPPMGAAPIDYASAGGGYMGPPPDKDSISMAMLAHLLGIIGFLGPLIIWLIKKDQSPFVDDQGKEALNFHLTMLIGYVAGIILSAFCIGALVLPVVWLISLIFSIIGAVNANKGIAYRYPMAIRFIK